MKKRILSLSLALILMFSLMIPAVSANESEGNPPISKEETGSVQLGIQDSAVTDATIEVTYSQSDARSMLKMINDFRANKDA